MSVALDTTNLSLLKFCDNSEYLGAGKTKALFRVESARRQPQQAR